MPSRRMHDQSRRLVHYQKVGILEQDVERYVLRLRFSGACLGPVNFDYFTGTRMMRRLDGAAVEQDVTLLDQPLNGAAGHGGKVCAQERVESLARPGVFDRDLCGARWHM